MDKKIAKITKEIIDDLIEKIEYQRIGKTIVVCLITIKYGIEVIGQSSDPKNDEASALHDAKLKLMGKLAYNGLI